MPAEDGDSAAAPKPTFVKKERRGNFRKKEKNETVEEEEGLSVAQLIEQTRMEQQLRQRCAPNNRLNQSRSGAGAASILPFSSD